jgi:hypothetical protein
MEMTDLQDHLTQSFVFRSKLMNLIQPRLQMFVLQSHLMLKASKKKINKFNGCNDGLVPASARRQALLISNYDGSDYLAGILTIEK